jgi:hypothetical protein
MHGPWTVTGAAEEAAIAASSAWNASYFARRAVARVSTTGSERARRIAAAVLALLFAAVAIEALAGIPVADTSAEVVRRTPLLLATVSVAFLVSYGGSAKGAAR